jgi:hypothetical protein
MVSAIWTGVPSKAMRRTGASYPNLVGIREREGLIDWVAPPGGQAFLPRWCASAGGGAAGVGKATTQCVVTSYILILIADFFLTMALNMIHQELKYDWMKGG